MASHGIADRVAIIGMGCTKFGERWDQSLDDLLETATQEALRSAAMEVADVDAFWFGTHTSGGSGLVLSHVLGVDKPVTRVENKCATGSEALRNACYAVASGAYDVVMAVGGEKLKDSGFSGLSRIDPPNDGTLSDTTAPANFGLIPPAYSARYGVDPELMKDVLTRIAWKNHSNGALNPRAQFQREVSTDTIRNAPTVAGQLGVFDCSGVSDGAAAAIIVRREDASRWTKTPVFVKGLSITASSGYLLSDPDYDYTSFPEVVRTATDAYQQAGITDPRSQLALAEVHDCFTPTELVLMEDLGFAERGTAWKDVLDGVFDREGALPVNPDGGLKAFGHPVGASGLRMMFECWLQLRQDAPPERQVSMTQRNMALTHNLGGQPGDLVSFVAVVGTE